MSALLAGAGEFAGQNNVHPVGLTALVVASVCMLAVRRGAVPVVLIALASLIPSAQRIVIAGADFNFVRFIVLIGLARQIARGEFSFVRWNVIDLCVFFGAAARIICFPIALGSADQLVASIGQNFEEVGAYLLVRCSIRESGDLRALLRAVAVLSVIAVPFFLIESWTGRNLFSVFGGIPEITNVREGKIRCRGPFSHAILAGCFFVAWLPLWLGCIVGSPGRDRAWAIAGIAASFVVVVCCASSTPVVALLLGFLVWIAFPVRAQLRGIYLAVIAIGFVLHFLMNKPIWHLIARIDLVGGSTGYHRYNLFNQAVERFGEWWLIGTKSTAHWGFGLTDITNQFVLEGVHGGIWAVLAMLGVLGFGYAAVGHELRRSAMHRASALRQRLYRELPRIQRNEAIAYGVGAALCAQMAIFMAVSYFGATVVVWQCLMAIAASLRQWSRDNRSARSLDGLGPSANRAPARTSACVALGAATPRNAVSMSGSANGSTDTLSIHAHDASRSA